MTAPINKSVRVLAGPTGPTGTFEGVHILASFTGPTGTFPIWNQITAAQQALSPTGTFKSVYPIAGTGPAGVIKTVIIPGYVPALALLDRATSPILDRSGSNILTRV